MCLYIDTALKPAHSQNHTVKDIHSGTSSDKAGEWGGG